jgi:hypothetical protein
MLVSCCTPLPALTLWDAFLHRLSRSNSRRTVFEVCGLRRQVNPGLLPPSLHLAPGSEVDAFSSSDRPWVHGFTVVADKAPAARASVGATKTTTQRRFPLM